MEPKDIAENTEVTDNESELDASINSTIDKIKAENHEAANPPQPANESDAKNVSEQATGQKSDSANAEASPAQEAPSEEGVQPENQAFEFKDPVKGKFESEESFQMRVQLAGLIKQKKLAKTDKEKSDLQGQIKGLRDDMSALLRGGVPKSPSFNNNGSASSSDDTSQQETDSNTRPMTQAEVDAMLNRRDYDRSVRETLDSFISSSPELKDPDIQQVYFDFIDANYQWQGKTGKDLRTVLDLAKQAMFRPNETVQEAALKGAKVQEKINAMQFPGGSIARAGLTPDQQKDVDDMVAAGIPESKARALILED